MSTAWTTTEGVQNELESAGFRHVQTEYIQADWHVKDPRVFVSSFLNSQNPGAKMVVGHLNDEELARCCDEWVKIVGEHGNVCKGVAVLGVGRN
jgi:hypothetical protein